MSDAPPPGWGQRPGPPQGYGGAGFGPPGAPPPHYGAPPPKRRNGALIAVVVVLAVVLVVGAGLATFLVLRADEGSEEVVAATPLQADGTTLTPAPLPPPAGSDESADGSDQSVFELAVGTCFNDPGSAEEIQAVVAVPCEEAHDNEVFALVNHPAGDEAPFPGREALSALGDEQCQGQLFEDYVGMAYPDSRYHATQLTPTEGSWAQGDREIVCLLYDPEVQITGSARGSAQ